MASYILGPINPVPCDNPVVVQCLCERDRSTGEFPVYPNHPAFTLDVGEGGRLAPSKLCTNPDVACVAVSCSVSTSDFSSGRVRFVGVVASFPTPHGAHHGHVSVFVRGAVTMACDVDPIRVRFPPFALEYKGECSDRRFAGYPVSLVPPTVGLADVRECKRMMGTVIEVGRAPINEVRILLAPEENYANNVTDAAFARARLDNGNINDAVQGLPLTQLINAINAAETLLRDTDKAEDADVLSQARNGGVDDVATAIVTAARTLLGRAATDFRVLAEIIGWGTTGAAA